MPIIHGCELVEHSSSKERTIYYEVERYQDLTEAKLRLKDVYTAVHSIRDSGQTITVQQKPIMYLRYHGSSSDVYYVVQYRFTVFDK